MPDTNPTAKKSMRRELATRQRHWSDYRSLEIRRAQGLMDFFVDFPADKVAASESMPQF